MDLVPLEKKVSTVTITENKFSIDGIMAEMIIEVDNEVNLPSPSKTAAETHENVNKLEVDSKSTEVIEIDASVLHSQSTEDASADDVDGEKTDSDLGQDGEKDDDGDDSSKMTFKKDDDDDDDSSKMTFARKLGLMRPKQEAIESEKAVEDLEEQDVQNTSQSSSTSSVGTENLNNLTMAFMHPQEISSVTVSELQQLKFSRLSLHEKVAIKKRGRSTPDIQIFQPGMSHNKIYIRSFNSEWYQRKSWLCGCEVNNALFCFPCLLFGGDVTWTKDGFRDITRMKLKIEKHEESKKHIENVVSLSLLGNVNIEKKLWEAYRLSISEHNIKVTKNREILSKIIECIFFCGNLTPLRGHDEKDDSVNPEIFKGLINFASKLDPDLKNHLETSMFFKDVSKTIQNEILDCLLQIYHEEIRAEIREASFVAVIADDTTDVSEHTQMVIVLRYMLKEEIFERFLGFFIPENQTADGISKGILEQLDVILQGNEQKLIAQTFDGANVMKGKKRRNSSKNNSSLH